jgi:hypothetical protein
MPSARQPGDTRYAGHVIYQSTTARFQLPHEAIVMLAASREGVSRFVFDEFARRRRSILRSETTRFGGRELQTNQRQLANDPSQAFTRAAAPVWVPATPGRVQQTKAPRVAGAHTECQPVASTCKTWPPVISNRPRGRQHKTSWSAAHRQFRQSIAGDRRARGRRTSRCLAPEPRREPVSREASKCCESRRSPTSTCFWSCGSGGLATMADRDRLRGRAGKAINYVQSPGLPTAAAQSDRTDESCRAICPDPTATANALPHGGGWDKSVDRPPGSPPMPAIPARRSTREPETAGVFCGRPTAIGMYLAATR